MTHPPTRATPATTPTAARRRAGGFTMTEILVVIGIIVIVLALAVPTFNIITGSNSINAAENQISAMLGRARGDALGLQQETGVFLFIDPATERVTLAQVFVRNEPAPAATRQVYLDLVADRDFLQLPAGVSAQLIDNARMSGTSATARTDDGYLGFNAHPTTGFRYGGVILFGANGRLVSRTYGFDFATTNAAGASIPTAMAGLFNVTGQTHFDVPETTGPPPVVASTAFGLALFEREPYTNRFGAIDTSYPDAQVAGGTYGVAAPPDGTTEADEELWLDENSTPLMINRYNGTLVRGE